MVIPSLNNHFNHLFNRIQCLSFEVVFIHRSKFIRDQLNIKDQSLDSTSPRNLNPYIKRITEIRETVTKNERIRGVSTRLRKCLTRNSLCLIHCLLALFLSVVLGSLFYQLPHTRDGIEKRENLFHIIVIPKNDHNSYSVLFLF